MSIPFMKGCLCQRIMASTPKGKLQASALHLGLTQGASQFGARGLQV